MKRFLLLVCLVCSIQFAQAGVYRVNQIPDVQLADASRYTSNPDGILSAHAVEQIDQLCALLREEGVAEVVVVAVEDVIGENSLFDFTHALFTAWGVGSAEKNDGLVIVLAANRHEIQFVTGYGLEGVLPDALCKRIQTKYMLPAFRKGDYNRGMVRGVEAVSEVLLGDAGTISVPSPYVNAPVSHAPESSISLLGKFFFWVVAGLAAFIGLIALLILRQTWRKGEKCPRCHMPALKEQKRTIISESFDVRVSERRLRCTQCGLRIKQTIEENVIMGQKEIKAGKALDDTSFGGKFTGEYSSNNSYNRSGSSWSSGRGGSSSRSSGGGSHGGGRSGGGGAGSRW